MTPLSVLLKRAGQTLKSNSPAILTALGVSGTVTTAYLANRAGYKHAQRMGEQSPYLSKREEAELVWRFYIPTAISGAVTIGCIIAGSRAGSRKAAAITAAYSLSEKAFVEYKDKVIEKFGENKEQAVRDEIAQDRVRNDPPPQNVVIASGGNVLCCEIYTGRYFQSDIETLRKAKNVINDKLNRDMYASLSDFYYILGLSQTQFSSDIGWRAGKLMELMFSTVFGPDEQPCLAFEYNYVSPID